MVFNRIGKEGREVILWKRKAYYGALCGKAVIKDETSMSYPLKSTLDFIFLAPEGLCREMTSGKLCAFLTEDKSPFMAKKLLF